MIDAYRNAINKSKVFDTSNLTTHAGTAKLQQQIEAGFTEEDIRAGWQDDLNDFKLMRNQYLIYN